MLLAFGVLWLARRAALGRSASEAWGQRLRPLLGFGFDLVDMLGPQATAAQNKSRDTSTCGRWPQRLPQRGVARARRR